MSGLTVKAPKNGTGSPKAPNSVGEIDTRAPFQSVKAAVSLFGESVSPRSSAPVTKKSKAEERVLEKETQHHMMQRELDSYKEHLKNTEAVRGQAQRDLERANRTLHQLTNKLEKLSESKQASIKATVAAKLRVKELEEQLSLRAQRGNDAWKADIEGERDGYKACQGELIAVKQELANLRQDFDAAVQGKVAVFHNAEDMQQEAQMIREKQSQLLKEVASVWETLEQVRLASHQAQEEHGKIIAEKESCLLNRKLAKEEAEREIKHLMEEYDPKDVLEQKLEQTLEAVKVLQDQLQDIQASDLNAIKTMASELDSAKKKLQQVLEEENAIRSSVEETKQQLKEVKKERAESEQKALKAEATAQGLRAELEKKKNELEAAMSRCGSVSLEKQLAETGKAKQEAEKHKNGAELLKQEAEAAMFQTKEAEEKLKVVLKEAEESKAAQKLAEDQIHNHPTGEAADSKDLGSVRKIRLSVEEFESMKKKIEEFGHQANIKVATAMAHVESINASEKETAQKLEEVSKHNEALQSEIDYALKRAEMAEAAKRVVENELQKWRENKQQEAGNSCHSSKSK